MSWHLCIPGKETSYMAADIIQMDLGFHLNCSLLSSTPRGGPAHSVHAPQTFPKPVHKGLHHHLLQVPIGQTLLSQYVSLLSSNPTCPCWLPCRDMRLKDMRPCPSGMEMPFVWAAHQHHRKTIYKRVIPMLKLQRFYSRRSLNFPA